MKMKLTMLDEMPPYTDDTEANITMSRSFQLQQTILNLIPMSYCRL